MAQAWQFARRHRLTRGSCAKPRLPHLDPHLTHLHIRMLLDARTPSVEQAAWGFLGIRQYSMRGKRALALDAVRSTNPPPAPPSQLCMKLSSRCVVSESCVESFSTLSSNTSLETSSKMIDDVLRMGKKERSLSSSICLTYDSGPV